MHLVGVFFAAGEQVDLLDLEHELVTITELLELAGPGHLLDLVFSLAQLQADLFERIEHLGHSHEPPGLSPLQAADQTRAMNAYAAGRRLRVAICQQLFYVGQGCWFHQHSSSCPAILGTCVISSAGS